VIKPPTLGTSVVYRTLTLVNRAAIVVRAYSDNSADLYVILPFTEGTEYKQRVAQADPTSRQPNQFTFGTY
jgi:hypothetical protein